MQYTPSQVLSRQAEPCPPQDGPHTARCADLAAVVGQLDLDDNLFAGSLLSSAVNEYAARTGRNWRFDPAAPPALLLRALSKLSIHAPETHSISAAVLLDAHDASARGAS